MKKLLIFVFLIICTGSMGRVAMAVPAAPTMSITSNGPYVTISWTPVSGATGYKMFYAPYPYTGEKTIGSLDMDTQTSVSFYLWEGAAYYIAIESYDTQSSSDYSNIDFFILDRAPIIVSNKISYDNHFTISINKQIELLDIIQYLADDQTAQTKGNYQSDVEAYFGAYRNHPVIAYYKEIYEIGFWFDAPEKFILACTDLPLMQIQTLPDDGRLLRIGEARLNQFLEYANEFYTLTNFEDFYKDHSSYYENLLLDTTKSLRGGFLGDELTSYYGYSQNSCNVIMTSLSSGGYGVRFNVNNNIFDAYSIVSSTSISTSLHEFGHTYINYLTSKYSTEVSVYQYMYDHLAEEILPLNPWYRGFFTIVNEYIIRAVVSRMMLKISGNTSAENHLAYNEKQGFTHIRQIYNKLAEYENSKSLYQNFEQFYLVLIDVFGEMQD